MKFTENRPVARAVLALTIAGSLLLGGGNALSRQEKAVHNAFFASSESIAAEQREMIDNAVVMNSIIANTEGIDPSKTEAVTSAIAALESAQTIGERYDAGQTLTSAVENLYSYASNLALSETDADDFRYKYKNFSSALLRISHDGYNDAAHAFNEEKDGFPAALISSLRRINDAELFE